MRLVSSVSSGSQLRLLSALASTDMLRVVSGRGGHADVDVSLLLRLLSTIQVPYTHKGAGSAHHEVIEPLAKYLKRRRRSWVKQQLPSSTDLGSMSYRGERRSYRRRRRRLLMELVLCSLMVSRPKRCELRIFGCRPFSDACAAACAAAFRSDVSVVARRALQSDFFADQGVERCASLNLDEDDLHALGEPSSVFRTSDVALEQGRSLGAAAAGLRRTASGYFSRDQFASRPVELKGSSSRWDALFPDRSGEGVPLSSCLPDKEPGFRAALCDLETRTESRGRRGRYLEATVQNITWATGWTRGC